jgi:glutamyl-tRNA reductase
MNASLNNFTKEVEAIKKNLPGNISRNDVNAIVKSMKKYIMNKTFNRLKKSSPNDRNRLLNNFKKLGLINTSDVVMLRNKLTP